MTFKCMDRGDVSFNLNKVTYFHKEYSPPATDFQLLMTVHIVQEVRVNDLWRGVMITDHHGRIEKKTVESDIVQSQQQHQLQQQLVYLL